MNLNDKCCDALGWRNDIQAELKRLYEYEAFARIVHEYIHGNDLLQPDLTTLLTAVRGLVSPEWISADLVRPTEPGWYWVLWRGHVSVCELEHIGRHKEPWWNDQQGGYDIPGTRYIKIKQPVAK
jgi:hypothetical protein